MKKRKVLSLILALVLCLSLLPITAVATDTGKAIQLVDKSGATPVAANIAGAQASSVYFGTYPQSAKDGGGYNVEPVKWRVLQNADGKLLLLSDRILDAGRLFDDDFLNYYQSSLTWKVSSMRILLNGNNTDNVFPTNYDDICFLNNAFTEKERAAVAKTELEDTTDKVFLLSYDEAFSSAYFPGGDERRAATETDYAAKRVEKTKNNPIFDPKHNQWWLRTISGDDSALYVTPSGGSGTLKLSDDGDDAAIRPAFNLDLSKVLFTSAAAGGKAPEPLGVGDWCEVVNYTGSDWKLTLKDADRNFAVSQTSVTAAYGDTSLELDYTDAAVGDNEYISALLADSKGNLLYYGRLLKPENADGKLYVPVSNLDEGSYTLKLFSEQYNGDYMTDYASAFSDVALTVEEAPLYGDANCDGQVDMGDSIAIQQYLGNKTKYPLTDQGKINADVVDKGEGLTGKDALAIELYLLGLLKALPVTSDDINAADEMIAEMPITGGKAGNDVKFSFVTEDGKSAVTLRPGDTVKAKVDFVSGDLPIAGLIARLETGGLQIAEIDDETYATQDDDYRLYSHDNNRAIRGYFLHQGEPDTLDSDNPLFNFTLSVPEGTAAGTYSVGFDEFCRIHKDSTSFIYGTACTPLTIKVEKPGPAEVGTWSELYEALNKGGSYVLIDDVTFNTGDGDHKSDILSVPEGATVTLDLNGKTVNGNGQETVITVGKGSLTVTDSSATEKNTVGSGTISGGYAGNNGGGVLITEGGSFTLEGGSIKDNFATNDGGGVYVDDGTFTMTGGKIEGNFVFTGNGAGVCVAENGTFNVSGRPVVTGNMNFSYETSNVYLPKDKVINVTGDVSDDAANASLGVTTEENTATVTSGLKNHGTKSLITSDKGLTVSTNDAGEAIITDSIVSIGTYAELKTFAEKVNEGSVYLGAVLTNDITATDDTWTPIGKDSDHAYKGRFDGDGHEISLLSNAGLESEPEYSGLFGYVGVSGVVTGVSVSGADLSVKGIRSYLGGIAGYLAEGTVSDCRFLGCTKLLASGDGSVSAVPYLGGIVGFSSEGTVSGCYASGGGELTSTGGAAGRVGGIVGYNGGTVEKCVYVGSGATFSGSELGCIVGNNNGGNNIKNPVTNCYAIGSLTMKGSYESDNELGGIVGLNSNTAEVENCYADVLIAMSASGEVNRMGAVVGDNRFKGAVKNCYYNTGVMTQTSAVGYSDSTGTTSGVSGIAGDKFASADSFDGFDFDAVWYMGADRPLLKVVKLPESAAVTFHKNDGSDPEVTATQTVKFNTETALDANTFKTDNMVFVGWKDSDGKKYADGEKVTLTDNLDLYAVWAVEIGTAEELFAFAQRVNGGETGLNAILTGNIDLNKKAWTPIGPDDTHAYTGTFNGAGYEISGLNVSGELEYAGLFGYIGFEGVVENLDISGKVETERTSCGAGGVAGYNEGMVQNCHYTGTVTATAEGGFAYAGGVAGYNNGTVQNCYNTGSVTATAEHGDAYAGGVAGYNNGTVQNCYNTGTVEAKATVANAGGVAGDNTGTLRNCYNTGEVKATARGEYSSASAGGVAGRNTGTIKECYYLTGKAQKGIGSGSGSAAVLNAEDFTKQEKFDGFDFNDKEIWYMGTDAPLLTAFKKGSGEEETFTVSVSGGAELTYGYGSGASLAAQATVSGYTVTGYQWYSCSDAEKTNPEKISDAAEASFTTPLGLDAGSYYYYCAVTAKRDSDGTTQTLYTDVVLVKIDPADFGKATIAEIPDQDYTGEEIKPEPKITWNGTTLEKDRDYTLSYENNVNPSTAESTATVIATGTGNFKSPPTKMASFRINPKPAEATIEVTAELTGRAWKEGDEFTFKLADAYGNTLNTVSVTNATPEHTASFDAIEFTAAGTYTYKVKETKGSIAGITYDETEYTVTIDVIDDENGNLVAAEGSTLTPTVTFSNSYVVPAPTITAQPEDLILDYGYTSASLTVTATAPEGFTLGYQWYINTENSNAGGAAIDGATEATYAIPAGKDNVTEYYYCTVTATKGESSSEAVSNAAKVTVGESPMIVNEEIYPDGSKTVTETKGNTTTVTNFDTDGSMVEKQIIVQITDDTVSLTLEYYENGEIIGSNESTVNVKEKTATTNYYEYPDGVKKSVKTGEMYTDESGKFFTTYKDPAGTNIGHSESVANGSTVTTKEYDASDNLISTTVTVEETDDNGKTVKITDTVTEGNTVTVTEYYPSGSVIKETETVTEGNKVTVTEKDADLNVTKVTETVTEGDKVIVTEKDGSGNVTQTTETLYYPNGTTVTETSNYDADGNLTRESYTMLDAGSKLLEKGTKEYNADGSSVETIESYEGGEMIGRQVTTTAADGKTAESREYDAAGNLLFINEIEIDGNKQHITIKNAAGEITGYAEGEDVTDENGNLVSGTYTEKDKEGNVVLTQTETVEYDENGNLIKSTVTENDYLNNTVSVFEYDENDVCVKTTVTVTEKDENGRVIRTVKTVTDITDIITDRVTTEYRPDGTTVITDEDFDENGNVTGSTETIIYPSYDDPPAPPATPNTPTTQTEEPHGEFTVNNQDTEAGDTVTIVSTPAEGCRTAKVTVTDANGNVLPVTRSADGTYSYVDPGTPVTVDVKYGEAVSNPFVDVTGEDFFYDPVLWAVENNVTTGTDATHFTPGDACTRAEMIAFLWRAAGCPAATISETPFEDVDPEAYYYQAVLWAYENGITFGLDDHTFGTDETVTRAESVTFIWRAKGQQAGGENHFGDVSSKDYCYDAVLWAEKYGVTYGTGDGEFNPGGDCLRGQIITFLYRAYA